MGSIRNGLAVLFAAGLVIAACGGDDDDAGDATETTAGDAGDTARTTGDATATTTGDAAETTETTETTAAGDATETTTGGTSAPEVDGRLVDLDGKVVYATCCVNPVLDPHNQAGAGITGWFSLYDRLTYLGTPEDPLAGEISPMVAESWEFSDDNLEMTITLRDDVTFNDGTPVTADAVKASLERAKASAYGAAAALGSVVSIEVVDDQTVVLTLSEPDAALPAALAGHAGAVMNPAVFNDPSADLDLAPPPGAGSGPFVLDTFEPGTRIALRRADDDYWDPEAAYLAELEMVGQPDTTARLNGLQAGDYNLAVLFSRFVPEGDRLADSGDFENYTIDGRAVSVLWLRYTNPELSDIRVRQAIAHAVDRAGISDGALAGTCTSIEQIWAPSVVGHDPDYETPYPYDLDRARALMDEAGVENLTVDAIFPTGATQEVIATALQASLAEIGVTLNIVGIPPSDTPAEFINGGHDGSVNAITAHPDASGVVIGELYDRTALAEGDETIAELAAAGKAETDPEARAEIYHELGDYVVNEVWAVPVCMAKFSWPAPTNVVNEERMPWNWGALPDNRYIAVVEDE